MQNNIKFETMEIPENIDQIIADAVQLGERKRKMQKRKKIAISCASVAAALVVCLGIGSKVPEVALAMEKVPIIGKISKYLYDVNYKTGAHGKIYYVEDAQTVVVGENEDTEEHTNDTEKNSIVETKYVTASDQGIQIIVPEYYWDDNSLFLSMQIISEQPFYNPDESADRSAFEGMIQLFGSMVMSDGEWTVDDTGSGSLNVDGVYLDEHTFVGIAKEEMSRYEESTQQELPDVMDCVVAVKHVKAYLMDSGVVQDLRGTWEFSLKVEREGGTVQIIPINVYSKDGYGILNVKMSPYEVHVDVIPDSMTAFESEAYEDYKVLAFMQDGTMLQCADKNLNAVRDQYDTWFFVNEKEIETLSVYMVNGDNWDNEWEGYLYDEGWSGLEMMKFLDEHNLVKAEVTLTE